MEVVLANGSIVTTNSTSYPDLFQALKGGGNNFGIVTNFNALAFPQDNFWGGNIGTAAATPAEYLAAVQAFAAPETPDPYSALMSTFSISSAQPFWLIISSLEYTKSNPTPAELPPPALKNFTEFPTIFNTMRVSNLSDFAGELVQYNPYGLRQLFATITIEPDLATMIEIFNIGNATAQSLLARNTTNLSFDVLYEPLPVSALTHGQDGTPNSLGLDQASGNLIIVLLDIMWSSAKDDNAIHSAVKSMFDQINKKATKGSVSDFVYFNYAGLFQDPISGYGTAPVKNLKAAGKKYDPKGIFQTLVPGGFKLPA